MRIVPGAVAILVLIGTGRIGYAGPQETHPALARYPSPEEVAQRIASLKSTDPESYIAAREDFDLAARSPFILDPIAPKLPDLKDRSQPIVLPPKIRLRGIRDRDGLERRMNKLEGTPGSEPGLAFLRKHLDDYCADDTPALRLVLLDVLMNGWDDWSAWQGEGLEDIKNAFPELHRAYALDLMFRYKMTDAHGLILRLLEEPSLPSYLRVTRMIRYHGSHDVVLLVV